MTQTTKTTAATRLALLLACALAIALASLFAAPEAAHASSSRAVSWVEANYGSENVLAADEAYASDAYQIELGTDGLTSAEWGDGVTGSLRTAGTSESGEEREAYCVPYSPSTTYGGGTTDDYVLKLTYEKAVRVNDRYLDVEIYITQVALSALYASANSGENFTYNGSSTWVGFATISATELEWGADGDTGWCYHGQVTVKSTTRLTWHDDGSDATDLGVFVAASDLDQVQTWNGHQVYESMTFGSAFESFFAYEGTTSEGAYLMVDDTSGSPRFYPSTDANTDGEESFRQLAAIAVTDEASFSTSWRGGTCATDVRIFVPDHTLGLEKEVDEEFADVGDDVVWTVTFAMPEYVAAIMHVYDSLVLTDVLPAGVSYEGLSVEKTDAASGETTALTQGTEYTLSVADADDGTTVVAVTFADSWVSDVDNYDGGEVVVTIESTAVAEGQHVNTATLAADDVPYSDYAAVSVGWGRLLVSKDVTASSGVEGEEFAFRVSATDEDGEPWEGAVIGILEDAEGAESLVAVDFSDGVAYVTLADGDTLLIGLPSGVDYYITETSMPDGYALTKATGTSGAMESGTTAHAAFYDAYGAAAGWQPEVSKTLNGGDDLGGLEFEFELADENGTVLQTATADEDGWVPFEAIEYTKTGTYSYTIYEVAGDEGYIDYDETVVEVVVTVTQADDGTFVAEAAYSGGDAEGYDSWTFHNTAVTGLSISKAVDAASLAAADATFGFRVVLTSGGVTLTSSYAYTVVDDATGLVVASGEVTSGGEIELSAGQTAVIEGLPGGTRYTVTEVDAADGYSATQRSGTTGTITEFEVSEASFTNSYAARGYATVEAAKTLDGRTLAAGAFEFKLADEDGEVVATAWNDADGAVAFDRLAFSFADVGEHVYTLYEVDAGAGGYTYDDAVYTVVVDVADVGDGTLSCDVAYYDADGAQLSSAPTFENSYAASGTATLTAYKTLSGGDVDDYAGAFSFELADEDGEVVAEAVNDGSIVSFELAFDQDDDGQTYVYTASEVDGGDEDVVYSGQTFAYTVTCRDDGDGTMSFDVSVDSSPVFENGLADGFLTVAKTVSDDSADDGTGTEFTFVVVLTGLTEELGELEYELTYADSASSSASSSAAASASVATLSAASLSALVDEEADDDAASAASDEDGVAAAATTTATGTSGGVTWTLYSTGVLNFKPTDGVSGTLRGYSAVADIPWLEYADQIKTVTVSGTVYATNALSGFFFGCENLTNIDGLANLQFNSTRLVNTFNGCSSLTSLDAIEDWDVSGVTSMAQCFEYCTSLTDVSALEGWDTGACESFKDVFNNCTSLADADCVAAWDTSSATTMRGAFFNCSSLVSLSLDGWDTASVTDYSSMFSGCTSLASLDLASFDTSAATTRAYMFADDTSDACLGDLEVLSSVKMGTKWDFYTNDGYSVATTVATGALPTPPSSTTGKWIRSDDNGAAYGAKTPATLANAWEASYAGTWVWQYDAYFTVNFSANAADATGSLASLQWNVDGGDVVPSSPYYRLGWEFTSWNTAADGSGTELAPGDEVPAGLAAEGASITLYAQWEQVSTVVDASSGSFTFTLHGGEAATFELPAGCSYLVYEQTASGWTLVSSSGTSGEIEPNETATASFENTYSGSSSVDVALYVGKTIDGKSAGDTDEFSFARKNYYSGNTIQTVSSLTAGYACVGEITYTKAGTYRFTISEVEGDDDAIEYDDSTYTATITVVEADDGTLSASVVYTDEDGEEVTLPVFENAYKPGSLSIAKSLEGAELDDQVFSATVSWSDGETETAVLDSSNGWVWSSESHAAGTSFTVTETDIPDGYSLLSSDGASGEVSAGQTSTCSLVNGYSASGSWTPQISKTMEGRELAAGDFSFALLDAEGETVSTASNDASGAVVFDTIEYTQAGTYTYYVCEVAGDGDEVVYDEHAAEATVTVADAGDGTLDVSVAWDGSTTFANSLEPGSLAVAKTVEGATAACEEQEFELALTFVCEDGSALSGVYPVSVYDADGDLAGETSAVVVDGTACDADGGGLLTIQAGQTLVVEELPSGVSYTVDEQEAAGYALVSASGETGVISAGEQSICALVNEYATSGSWTPAAVKIASGDDDPDVEEGQFGFVVALLTDDDAEVVSTGESTASASTDGVAEAEVAFGAVSYDATDDGQTYTYAVYEADDGQDGWTYDDAVYYAQVAVSDAGDGTMSVSVVYTDEDGEEVDRPTFENAYSDYRPLVSTGGPGVLPLAVAASVGAMASAALALRRGRRRAGRCRGSA